jgi:hypothetical protein
VHVASAAPHTAHDTAPCLMCLGILSFSFFMDYSILFRTPLELPLDQHGSSAQ